MLVFILHIFVSTLISYLIVIENITDYILRNTLLHFIKCNNKNIMEKNENILDVII